MKKIMKHPTEDKEQKDKNMNNNKPWWIIAPLIWILWFGWFLSGYGIKIHSVGPGGITIYYADHKTKQVCDIGEGVVSHFK